MKSMEELVAHVKAEGYMIEHDPKVVLNSLKAKFNVFIENLGKEGKEDKVAFRLIVQATFEGKELTHEEKVQVEEQLKDSLKTVGLVALTVLPGGTLFFILANFLKLNKYIIPSAFLNKGSQQ